MWGPSNCKGTKDIFIRYLRKSMEDEEIFFNFVRMSVTSFNDLIGGIKVNIIVRKALV